MLAWPWIRRHFQLYAVERVPYTSGDFTIGDDMEILRIGHSPDPDDAFMFYAFATEKVTIDGYKIEQVLEDIESLNRRAQNGELEVTAISAGAYPGLAEKYQIMPCGASVGRDYGPIVVSKQMDSVSDLAGKRIGIPGEFTTAYLLLRIYLDSPFDPVFLDFDKVGEAVSEGSVSAGVIIHEGQIMWREQGFTNLLDLGKAWGEDTGLPIPLGLDVVSRQLHEDTRASVAAALEASIRHAMANEDAAVDYALPFGRGMERELCRRFVRMYVNEDTINMGEEGRRALETLYKRAHDRGLIQAIPALDIIGL